MGINIILLMKKAPERGFFIAPEEGLEPPA